MKRTIITLLTLFISLIFSFSHAEEPFFRQSPYTQCFKKGNSFVTFLFANDFYFNANKIYFQANNEKRTQGFEGKYEYYISNALSIGGFAGYCIDHLNFDNKVAYKSLYNNLSLGAVSNLQLMTFDREPYNRLIFYMGGRLGYKRAFLNSEILSKELNTEVKSNYSGIMTGIHIGFNFFFNKKISLQGEFGAYYSPAAPKMGNITGIGRAGLAYNL